MKITIYAVLILFLSACSTAYYHPEIGSKTAHHSRVAILPAEMIMTGKVPKKLTEEDIRQIEIAESKTFQLSLYNQVLRSTRNGKKPIRVEIQHYQQTLKILEDNGIPIRESWAMEPQELANILGVEAVLKTRVEKKRYMSNLASYGIDIATDILYGVSGGFGVGLPLGMTKTNDIRVSSSLLNGTDSAVLFSKSEKASTDWSTPVEQTVDNLNRRIAKKFPYRSS